MLISLKHHLPVHASNRNRKFAETKTHCCAPRDSPGAIWEWSYFGAQQARKRVRERAFLTTPSRPLSGGRVVNSRGLALRDTRVGQQQKGLNKVTLRLLRASLGRPTKMAAATTLGVKARSQVPPAY